MFKNRVEFIIAMYEKRNDFVPALSIKDILEIGNSDGEWIQKIEQSFDRAERWKDIQESLQDNNITNYTTKKSIQEDIKLLNQKINDLVIEKRTGPGYMYDMFIEEAVSKRNKLKALASIKGNINTSKGSMNIEAAKAVPIDSLISFNGSGFAKLPMAQRRNRVFEVLQT